MDGRRSRADSFFRQGNGARKTADASNWKAIKDADDKRRNQITAKLRTARLAREASEALAREAASASLRRSPQEKKGKRK
jgi:hypothetical protein